MNDELKEQLKLMMSRLGCIGDDVNDLMWRLEDVARENCLNIEADRTSFETAIWELEAIRSRLRSKIR